MQGGAFSPGRCRPWVALALVGVGAAHADRGVDTANTDHPIVPAVRVTTPPVLDGVLDDPIWAHAPRLDNFYSMQLDRAPTESTVVWIVYDSTHIYAAARCYDRQPENIRAEQTKRGGSMWTDDCIEFDLDPVHGHRRVYEFCVNAAGTQYETVPGGSASKVEWRGDWLTATRTDSLGWTAELAIPLSFLNRPAGPQTVGLGVWRHLSRGDEWVQWPNMGKSYDATRLGDWTGVVFPHIRRRPAFMPYVVARASRVTTEADTVAGIPERRKIDPGAYLGLDAKYTTTGGTVCVGTLNPDFENVESQVLNLDFSYSERYRGENRPFFQEGGEYLPSSRMFYTQRVEEMYGGLKVFGEPGQHRIGIVEAYDRKGVNHTAAKWGWRPGSKLTFEQSLVWRHGPRDVRPRDDVPLGEDHIAVGEFFSGTRRFSSGAGETVQATGGLTHAASDSGRGHELWVSYNCWGPSKEGGSIWVEVGQRSGGFMPADGLLSKVDADQRNVNLWLNYWHSYDRRWMKRWWADAGITRAVRFNGDLYRQEMSVSGGVNIVQGVWFDAGGEVADRPPHKDRTANVSLGWNEDHLNTTGNVGAWGGRLDGTDYLSVSAEQGIQPFSAITLRFYGQYVRQDYPVGHEDEVEGGVEHRHQVRATVQYDITPERSISGRMMHTDGGTNGYCSYRQMLRRGMDVFVIVGDPSAETWTKRVALKTVIVL